MNSELTLLEGLKAYLTGLGRSNPDALAFIAEYGHWPDLAVREIERRAAAVLSGLSDIELVAIAWEVDLREVAQQVQQADNKRKRKSTGSNDMAKPVLSAAAQHEIAEIARVHLRIETLEVRKRDSLDFHNVAVWNVWDALAAAYLAGMVDHLRERE